MARVGPTMMTNSNNKTARVMLICDKRYSSLQPGDHGNQGNRGDADNQQHLGGGSRGQTKQITQTGSSLGCSDPKGGSKSEQGRKDCEDINNMSRPTPDPFAQDGVKDRAHSQGEPLVERKECQTQGNH